MAMATSFQLSTTLVSSKECGVTHDFTGTAEESTKANIVKAAEVDTGFHSIVDALTSRNIETAVNVGMLPAIVVMGVSTNVITMVVFARQVTMVTFLPMESPGCNVFGRKSIGTVRRQINC